MKTSRKGRRFVERHEGLRLCPYKADPSERYFTIGYGHFGSDVKPGVCITSTRASQLLKADLERFEHAVRRTLRNSANVTQQEFDALVSFSFNLGEAVILDEDFSTLARRIRTNEGRTRDGRKKIYRDELPKWVKAGGRILPGLVLRRADEVKLACTGAYR